MTTGANKPTPKFLGRFRVHDYSVLNLLNRVIRRLDKPTSKKPLTPADLNELHRRHYQQGDQQGDQQGNQP